MHGWYGTEWNREGDGNEYRVTAARIESRDINPAQKLLIINLLFEKYCIVYKGISDCGGRSVTIKKPTNVQSANTNK